MSDLKFSCPHCKQSLEAPTEMLGHFLECPACKRQIQVLRPQLRQIPPPIAPQSVSLEINRDTNPLGIAALVVGIIACLFCWIPFLGLFVIPLACIGMLLAVIGFIMAVVSKKMGFAFPVSGGIICMLSIFVAIATTGGCAKAVSDIMEKEQRTHQMVISAPPLMIFPPPNTRNIGVGVARSPNAIRQPSPAPAMQWNKSSSVVRQGAVQVQITGVTVGKLSFKDMFGVTKQSADKLLIITVVVSNISTGKKIDFSTWRGADFSAGRDFASLSDDNQNGYKRIDLGMNAKPIGSVDSASIYPGKAITDVLVFEKPIDTAKWVHLELPAKNFGGDGMIRFEVP